MKNSIETLKSNLHSLLKQDYAITIYSDLKSVLILSFYHLNSVYSGLLWISKKDDYFHINWQYHKYNKRVQKTLETMAKAIQKIYKLKHPELIEEEINFYNERSQMVYQAKYSYETNVHTN